MIVNLYKISGFSKVHTIWNTGHHMGMCPRKITCRSHTGYTWAETWSCGPILQVYTAQHTVSHTGVSSIFACSHGLTHGLWHDHVLVFQVATQFGAQLCGSCFEIFDVFIWRFNYNSIRPNRWWCRVLGVTNIMGICDSGWEWNLGKDIATLTLIQSHENSFRK